MSVFMKTHHYDRRTLERKGGEYFNTDENTTPMVPLLISILEKLPFVVAIGASVFSLFQPFRDAVIVIGMLKESRIIFKLNLRLTNLDKNSPHKHPKQSCNLHSNLDWLDIHCTHPGCCYGRWYRYLPYHLEYQKHIHFYL